MLTMAALLSMASPAETKLTSQFPFKVIAAGVVDNATVSSLVASRLDCARICKKTTGCSAFSMEPPSAASGPAASAPVIGDGRGVLKRGGPFWCSVAVGYFTWTAKGTAKLYIGEHYI